MKLISVKCPNCNANLKIKQNSKKMQCEYCGSTVLLDDGTIKVKHIVEGQITEEQEFINAATNLNKIKDYEASYKGYLSLSKRYVNNEEIWIGLLRSLTQDFTYKYASDNLKKEYQKYWSNYISLAEEKDIKKYREKYQKYVDKVKVTEEKSELQREDNEKCYIMVTIFGGILGIHKFLKKDIIMGSIYFFTFGLFFIGWIKDIISECQKWPDSKQIKTSKYIASIIFILFGAVWIEYSIITFCVIVLGAILIPDFIWDKINIKNKYLRISLPIIFILIGMMLTPNSIPENFYGSWQCKEENCKLSEIKISEDNTYLIYNGKELVSSYSYYEENILVFEVNSYEDFKFKYIETDDELCILNKNDKCEQYYNFKK